MWFAVAWRGLSWPGIRPAGSISREHASPFPLRTLFGHTSMPHDITQFRFSIERLSRLSQLEQWHFWFVGRRVLIDRLFKRYLNDTAQPILDVGCGTGLLLKILMHNGYRVVGLDLRPEGLYTTRQAFPRSSLLQADATHLPLRDNVFGAVILLDILEHVDDQLLLAEVRRVLRPGGWALITVPANPRLWSYRDEAAGHLRRYPRRELLRVISNAQLRLQEVRYYQCLLLPLMVITRALGRKRSGLRDFEEQPLGIFNAAMTWINSWEARLSDRISWPWGSSLVAICQKV